MLIEFSATNFRSFRTEQSLSMVAAPFQEHRKTNAFNAKLPGFGSLLRSAAVYGANAAGKTNLLRALQVVQAMVLNSASAAAGSALPYQPFRFSKSTRTAPSEFQVSFAQDSVRYEYGFSFDAERVHEEWLMEYVNPRGREIFARKYDGKNGEYEWKFGSFLKGERSYWRKATRPEVLFLSRATQLNSKQLLPVFEWFQKRLVVLVGPTSLNTALTLQMLEQPGGKEDLMSLLREADLGIADIEVKREPFPMSSGNSSIFISGSPILEQVPGNQAPNLVRVTLSHYGEDREKLGLDLSEESAGTQVVFRTAGAWFNIFKNGEVVLIDEIDTSLHPKLTRFLIEKFHSGKTNANNAQLIFTTHNTSLLDQDLFRRDQIWFVDKGLGGESKLYPLTDFKPRNDEVLERWYMRGRYGALPILKEVAR